MSFPKNIVNRILHQIDNATIALMPSKKANLRICSKEGLWNEYFQLAEADMDDQWREIIFPQIRDFDFEAVLELAPGRGRNTEKLCGVSKKIYAVDLNSYALNQCRERIGEEFNGCSVEYHLNNGTDLAMIADSEITAIYCWDAAVHFDKEVTADYIREFARILKAGCKGFVHHSNLGDIASKDLSKNPHWRSNVSKDFFADICRKNSLRVVSQTDIPWAGINDCTTVFAKD